MLNEQQKEAVEKKDCSLLIVAGAGTGKTRVLVEKISHLLESGVSGHRILALTFTNKAADEMRSRVLEKKPSSSPPFIGTFHSFCVSLLRDFYVQAGVPDRFVIFDRDACRRILKRCMKGEGISDVTPRVVQHVVGQLKTGLASDSRDHLFLIAERILPLYRSALEEERALDFDDLISRTIDLLQKNIAVRNAVQDRYSYILVDEFQDTDGAQNRLVSLLKGGDTFIVAVGDTDQTIYSWRGASVHGMLSFTELYDPVSMIFLTQNYRSSGTILTAANAVIAKNVFRQDKDLIATRSEGEKITLLCSDDGESEAAHIASSIVDLRQNDSIAYCDIAVLFRANFQARALEMQMLNHDVPYTVLGARFFERSEIKDLLAYLTLVQNPNSQEAFARAVSVPRRGVGARTLERIFSGEEHLLSPAMTARIATFRSCVRHITSLAEKCSVSELLKELIVLLEYRRYLVATFDNPDERMQEVGELVAFADRFSHLSGTEGIAHLLADVALSSEQDSLRTAGDDAVRLMTVHAAKGLEFSCVFISGMEEGLFPFSSDEHAVHDAEEERRLCYVAMTRAKDRLFFSFARRRNVFGSYRSMRPSSFLSDIPEHLVFHLDNSDDSDFIESSDTSIAW